MEFEATNYNLFDIVTPVNVKEFRDLLIKTNYDQSETDFLISSFSNGFPIGYKGPTNRQTLANNLKLRVGSEQEIWHKLMKEVKLKRVAGPFTGIPYDNFIQSPIGLVPKQQNGETRLIFHLSYPHGNSLNSNTPKEDCSVQYSDFQEAVKLAMSYDKPSQGNSVFLAKSDLQSAFRNLSIAPSDRRWLVMKAKHKSGKCFYFVDLCLPFGASISCKHFTRVSNAIAHIQKFLTKKNSVAYLDDFLFGDSSKEGCDWQVSHFIKVCQEISFKVSMEKTFFGAREIVFLGILINTETRTISIPTDKRDRALTELDSIIRGKKATVLEIQKITGLLNFLCRAIFPGRAFTRRLYAKISSNNLKQHHHVRVDTEMRSDLQVWKQFLNGDQCYCRPFVDFEETLKADVLDWYTDSSASVSGGMGLYFSGRWSFGLWGKEFILSKEPSIAFLELYAVACAIQLWSNLVSNKRVVIFVDNESVVNMINSGTSSCYLCMKLIRIITYVSLCNNVRFFAKHVPGKLNVLADLFSRNKIAKFRQLAPPTIDKEPKPLPYNLWPINMDWWKN